MDKYDFQAQFLLELLENNFKITIQDLEKKGVLPFVVNSNNHESLKSTIINVSRRDFKDNKHKKNYALKSISKLSRSY